MDGLDVLRKMSRFFISPILTSLLCLIGCSCVTSEQAQFLRTARTVNHFPMKREAFISALSLDEQSSSRISDIISQGLFYRETWNHESGLTITATDSKPAKINYGVEFDKMITSAVRDIRKQEAKRDSFDFFVVAKGNRVLYQSWKNKTSLLTPDPPPVQAVMTATPSTPGRSRAPGQA